MWMDHRKPERERKIQKHNFEFGIDAWIISIDLPYLLVSCHRCLVMNCVISTHSVAWLYLTGLSYWWWTLKKKHSVAPWLKRLITSHKIAVQLTIHVLLKQADCAVMINVSHDENCSSWYIATDKLRKCVCLRRACVESGKVNAGIVCILDTLQLTYWMIVCSQEDLQLTHRINIHIWTEKWWIHAKWWCGVRRISSPHMYFQKTVWSQEDFQPTHVITMHVLTYTSH